MSHWAQGWAQRQKLGDPVAKAVLQTMCYFLRDETLLVFVSIETLEEFTEFEARAVRKAQQRLAELGVLVDTGQKKRNVTVWRMPGYEQWLANQMTPPQDGRGPGIDARALAQVAELTKEKKVAPGAPDNPSPKGEGSPRPLPLSSSTPPALVPRPLPLSGGNLNPDLNRSSEGTNPSQKGEGSEKETEPRTASGWRPPHPDPEVEARRSHWRVQAANHVIGECRAMEIRQASGCYAVQFKQLPTNVRMLMPEKIEKLIDWALEQERPPRLKSANVITAHILGELTLELRAFKPPSVAERQAQAG